MTSQAAIDHALGEWKVRLERIDENLVALESEPTYAMLAASAGHADLAGKTKEIALPAVKAVTELFEQRGRLAEIVERATTLRADVGFFGADEKLREIDLLLNGASIGIGHLSTGIGERSLLGAASSELTVTPAELLARMVAAFDEAKRVVAAVQRAWGDIEPRLAATEAELARLRELATSGPSDTAELLDKELKEADAELAKVRRDVARDPLGAADRDRDLGGRVASLRSSLHAALEARDFVVHGLAKGAHEIVTIERLDRAAEAAQNDVRRLFVDADHALVKRIDRRLLDDLVTWRTTLEATAHAGRWRAAYVGVQRWLDTATELHAAASAAVASAQSLATKRDELTGRLSARRAQVQALARRGVVVPPNVEAAAREAEHLLTKTPINLVQAEHAVHTFEATVIALR